MQVFVRVAFDVQETDRLTVTFHKTDEICNFDWTAPRCYTHIGLALLTFLDPRHQCIHY